MDTTDRNNEKFDVGVQVLGRGYRVHFYFNKTSKDYMYWGITPWSQASEDFVKENMRDELIALAEKKIEARKGNSCGTLSGFGSVASEHVYPNKYRRG